MALATKNTPAPVVQPPATYTLVLSEAEAETLLAVSRRIGGYCASRWDMDAISKALRNAGVPITNPEIDPKFQAIHFLA